MFSGSLVTDDGLSHFRRFIEFSLTPNISELETRICLFARTSVVNNFLYVKCSARAEVKCKWIGAQCCVGAEVQEQPSDAQDTWQQQSKHTSGHKCRT